MRPYYYNDSPEHLKPVSETEFVEKIAAISREGGGAAISAIVSRANLRLAELDEVLDAHVEAAPAIVSSAASIRPWCGPASNARQN